MAQFIRESQKVPEIPWVYHIVHIDRLQSILEDGFLFSDAEMSERPHSGTTIGMLGLKDRRKQKYLIPEELAANQCVPFYFCPRSPMLYVISRANNPNLLYRGGQEPILHLVFDPSRVATWAEENQVRFFVTSRTVVCNMYDVYQDLEAINRLDWTAIKATQWGDVRSEKAAEFLVEAKVPIALLQEVGVQNEPRAECVRNLLLTYEVDVPVRVAPEWYY